MTGFDYFHLLIAVMPETLVTLAAFGVLAVDLLVLRDAEVKWRGLFCSLIAILGAIAGITWLLAFPPHTIIAGGVYVADSLTALVRVAILTLAIVAMLLSTAQVSTAHTGEYLALVLLSAVGMMFLVSTENLLMLFVALELTSLSLYILSALDKKARSAEAALKYFLFGAMSAAFTLFGLSLVYGMSGAVTFSELANSIAVKGVDPLFALGVIMSVIGFAVKVAAAPFHLWAPDTYHVAPLPSAAFIASASKVAGFFILAKLLIYGFAGAEGGASRAAWSSGWVSLVSLLALASIIAGNLLAIAQSSVRRLIAYSAVAHAGYALLGIVAGNETGMASLIYYVVTYGLTVAGAFGVVAVVQGNGGDDRLAAFAGLHRTQPLASACMLVFMLSLAGIPPLAGFFGKFYVFAAVLQSNMGLVWLVAVALLMSAVSLYYYLQVLKQIYVADGSVALGSAGIPWVQKGTLAMAAAGVVGLGCVPAPFVRWITEAISG